MITIPKSITIDVRSLRSADLEYFCPYKEIERQICQIKGIFWSAAIAALIDTYKRYYLVVKTNREYDVIEGTLFEDWLNVNSKFTGWGQTITPKAKECINQHLAQRLYKKSTIV